MRNNASLSNIPFLLLAARAGFLCHDPCCDSGSASGVRQVRQAVRSGSRTTRMRGVQLLPMFLKVVREDPHGLFLFCIAAEERTAPVRCAGTVMPLRRNGDAVAPERRWRCAGTATRCKRDGLGYVPTGLTGMPCQTSGPRSVFRFSTAISRS